MTRIGRALVLLLLLLAGWSRVHAETVSSPQLRASYCLAVARMQQTRHEEESKRAGSGTRDSIALALRMARERRARLERFLERNGIALDDEDADLSAARERGMQDVEGCDRESKVAPYKTCNDDCMTRIRAADQQIICMMGCPSPEACQRIKACLDRSVP